jgi:ribosomal protein S14
MYGRNLLLLAELEQSLKDGYPWVTIPDPKCWRGRGSRTKRERTLVNYDLIVISPDPYTGERAYKITRRGINLLKAYRQRERRNDKLCPRCNEKPRHVSANGRVAGYCKECKNEVHAEVLERQRHKPNNQPCANCGREPRAVSSSGHIFQYCRQCLRDMGKHYREKNEQERLQRVKQGEVILCSRCGERPAAVRRSGVKHYCDECIRYFDRKHKRNRKLRIMRQAFKRQEGGD